VGFKLGLPPANEWNGKFFEVGCGGACGSTAQFDGGASWTCPEPLRRGFACIAFDAGHSDSGDLWAVNNLQAQIDFGYRGAHVTAVAGKAITERYYGKAPTYSYFCGCSTGGRMALVEAERFPWDFNGIVSGAPWINDADSAMNFVWANRALRGVDGRPIVNRKDLRLLHEAVLAQCDLDDGVADGIISNPASCRFDPKSLICKTGQADRCLTPAQVAAVTKVYSGPVNSKGNKLYISGAALGSEMGWVDDGVLDYIRSDGSVGGSEGWALSYFRYMVMPAAGPNWQLTDFDFDRDSKRFGSGTQESLLSAANPDLRKFKAAGGKLLIYQGWNDQSDLPQMTIDYYETVLRTMGGRANTEDFARLFVIPGMLHCTGGDGAFAIDYLTALEHWVEDGQVPDKLIGAHVDDTYLARLGEEPTESKSFDIGSYDGPAKFMGALKLKLPLDPEVPITFTRPIYPYPLRAKYKGAGDPTDTTNFEPVGP
jgi:feruloyl esterase